MNRDRQPSRCKNCGGEIAFVRCKSKHADGRPKFTPVQLVRRDGTGTDPTEMYSQRRHIRHDEVCPWAERHQGEKAKRIADRALDHAPPSAAVLPKPAAEMSDADLLIAAKWYRGRKKPGPAQRARLAEILTEIDRRKKASEAQTIATLGDDYSWDDQ